MKKNFILTLGFSFFITFSSAQNKETKKADHLFSKYEYSNAAKEYLKLVDAEKADAYVYKQLGDIYFLTYKNEDAIKWYKEAMTFSQDAEMHIKFAQVLKESGKIKEFIQQMDTFSELYPNDTRSISYLAKRNSSNNSELSVSRAEVVPVAFNSKQSDFGAVLINKEIYFTTNRPGRKRNRINKMTDQPFNKVFVVSFIDGKENAEAVEAHSLNSRSHDGTAAFTANGKTSYLSSSSININEFVRKRKDRFEGKNYELMTLFKVSYINDGFWSDYEVLSFCDKDYTYKTPILSPDEKKLYFSSDMPGGYGGLDIWSVNILKDGTFDTPQNLGPHVNSEFDESFPFISQDAQTLYFASKGHDGLGGYDIFFAPMNDLDSVQNLGKPFNSENDDFGYAYYENDEIGFFSSNRSGINNIYKIVPPNEQELIADIVDPETGLPVENATVNILDKNGQIIATTRTDKNGKAVFYMEVDQEYRMQVEIPGYETYTSNLEKSSKGKKQLVTSMTKKVVPELDLTNYALADVYFDFDQFNLNQNEIAELDKIIVLMKEHQAYDLQISSHTDSRGKSSYNKKLSIKRAQTAVDYLVLNGIDQNRLNVLAQGEDVPAVNCLDQCTEEEHAKNRRCEFKFIHSTQAISK